MKRSKTADLSKLDTTHTDQSEDPARFQARIGNWIRYEHLALPPMGGLMEIKLQTHDAESRVAYEIQALLREVRRARE